MLGFDSFCLTSPAILFHNMTSPWNRVAPGIYRHSGTKKYYERTKINGKRTWRVLSAHKLKFATDEAAAKRTQRSRIELGIEKPEVFQRSLSVLIDEYHRADCPDRHLHPRQGKSLDEEKRRCDILKKWWGDRTPQHITLDTIAAYAKWRMKHVAKDGCNGRRSTDQDLATLSNVIRYHSIHPNPLLGRQTFWREADARHCRDCAPRSGSELHELANRMFDYSRTHTLGWQLLFEALTGCRTNEICQMRADAKDRNTPGFVEGDWLWLKRSKHGVNPFVALKDRPELRELLAAHRNWLEARYPGSPWMFPSPKDPSVHISFTALTRRLAEISPDRKLTSHGLRAFYVLVRRGQGIADGQIAAEIGDKTVELIRRVYGDIPPGWQGGSEIAFTPERGEPAWKRFDGGITSGIKPFSGRQKSWVKNLRK